MVDSALPVGTDHCSMAPMTVSYPESNEGGSEAGNWL